jgi:hypothetical protein
VKPKKILDLMIYLLAACLTLIPLTFAECPTAGEDGEENSAPIVVFPQSAGQLLVGNAGSPEVNGAYLWDDEWSYIMDDTYYVFPYIEGTSYWVIHTETDISSHSEGLYYVEDPVSDQYRPPLTGWSAGTGTDPAPDLVGPGPLYLEAHAPGDFESFDIGQIVYANYVYVDVDGDPEGNTLFQWYRGDSETGPWTALTGETGATYTLTADDDSKWLRIEITPVAQSGTLEGEPVAASAGQFIRNM